ncbi:MAG TPA: glycosyltransferase [Planctomycetota bacterium]
MRQNSPNQSMTDPPVSILIATYNQANFVEETLISALEQEYDPLEVVVADDGSSDDTPRIITRIQRKYPGRLFPILGERNVGITGNCNRALRRCGGRFIALQGGDDVLLPGKIRKQVDWLSSDDRRVICYHDVDVFDSGTGKTLGLYSTRHPLRTGDLKDMILLELFFASTSVMFRSSFAPPGGYDERIPHSSDFLFLLQILGRAPRHSEAVGFIPGVFARYRRHPGNVTRQADLWGLQETLLSLDLIRRDVPDMTRYVRLARSERLCSYGLKRLARGRLLEGIHLLLRGGLESIHGLRRSLASGVRHMKSGRSLFP